MENVNKIQIRLDTITTSAATISIPFGLDFFPVDNTELQQVEFVEKETEKAVNPIFDHEKYPFYPTFLGTTSIVDAFTVEYQVTNTFLDFLSLTEEDINFLRNPFKKIYLRLNIFDSKDTKVQRLIGRETIHLQVRDDWYVGGVLKPLNLIPLTFFSNFQNLFYNSRSGEGFNIFWYKNGLPKKVYISASIMNAKTGKVTNLYSNGGTIAPYGVGPITPTPGNPLPVIVTSNGFNYTECEFYSDLSKRQQYYYIFNGDNISQVVTLEDGIVPINNKITILLNPY